QVIPTDEKLQLAIFNLGYLPSGNKEIITQSETTIKAIQSVLERLDKMGLLLIASYVGHPGGMEEFEAVQSYLEKCDQKSYNVAMFNFLNQKNLPPRLFIVERRQ
ncbi:tRNA (mnm(5)s(2)U34)-methyltransferase, partial [Aerococcus urinaeequi]|uniref:tRNA (mnm(5)s(2)U34)-methyltransferase n=2 Tax=Aerococcus TaxID=1375 RepID=UPI003D6B6F20